jgi:chitinase
MQNSGYVRDWDPKASAPFLYNPEAKVFISYEDPESLTAKCKYVLDQKLAGIMFWEYSGDSGGVLLQSIDTGLHRDAPATTEAR